MKSYSENITVGSPLKLPIQGSGFNILRSEAGDVLTVEFIKGGTAETNRIENVGKGLKARTSAGFDGIKISTTVSGVVDFIVLDADDDLELWFNTDEVIIGNENAQAIPVKTPAGEPLEVLFAGTVEPVLGVVTVDNTTAEAIPVISNFAATVTNGAAVAASDVEAAIVALDATRRGLRIKNAGANPVAIGGTGITYATAAVILQAGETWNENEAPGAAWFAICDAGLTSTLHIQTLA